MSEAGGDLLRTEHSPTSATGTGHRLPDQLLTQQALSHEAAFSFRRSYVDDLGCAVDRSISTTSAQLSQSRRWIPSQSPPHARQEVPVSIGRST